MKEVVIGSLWLVGRVLAVLGSLYAEQAGDLVAEGVVLGPQAGDLGFGGAGPLAKRVSGGALCGDPGPGWVWCPLLADEVADLVLVVEPCPGNAG